MKTPYWGMMLNLGNKMWTTYAHETRMRFDEDVFDEAVERCVGAGVNSILLDLGEGMRFRSHPELAVENSYSPDRLRELQARLKERGIDLIPKLNFSATHDHWLGPWRLRLCTPEYYETCRELLQEVAETFRPEIMHLGLEEEGPEYQRGDVFIRCRQRELWWHDTLFYIDACRSLGMRSAVWPGYCHDHPEEYVKNMPKDVLQFPYYYADWWDDRPEDLERLKSLTPDQVSLLKNRFRAFNLLVAEGYTCVPCGSTWSWDCNFPQLADYCTRHYPAERIAGYLQTTWFPTDREHREVLLKAIDILAETKNGTSPWLSRGAASRMTAGSRFE